MPFVRCRFFTDSGEPWRGGCRKGSDCKFVHPDKPTWANAPPSNSRPKGGDSAGFRAGGSWGNAPASAGWDLGAITSTSGGDGPDTGGWDTGGGEASVPASPATNQSAKSWNVSALVNEWNRADPMSADNGQASGSEGGWGQKEGWGASPRNNAWGVSWGGAGSPHNNPWGPASSSNPWGDSAWGSGDAGDKKDSTNSWPTPEPMDVDQPEKLPESSKGKSKATLAPPRIRIPGNEDKPERPLKITGTNNVPTSGNKWGSGSAITTTSASIIATPAATSTPMEPPRLKRKRESDFDEKTDTFKEYNKAWERAIRARFMVEEAEAKRKNFFRLQKSQCYQRVGEAGRKILDDKRTELDKEIALQREKLSGAITSLIVFHDTISSDLDLGQRYNISEEAAQFISEANAFIDKLRALLVTQVLKLNDVPSDDHQPPLSSDDQPLTPEFLQRQIRDLGERLEDSQTELTLLHERDISAEINEKLDDKLADMRAKRHQEVERVALQPRPEIVIPPSALKSMGETTQRVQELDADIPKTVDQIKNLLLRVEDLTHRVNRAQGEVNKNREIYRKMEERAASIWATKEKTDEQIKQLETRFEQLTTAQADSARLLSFNLQEKVLEGLRPAFDAALEQFYQHEVQPAIQALRKAVSEASDQHQQDAIAVLWGKLQPAMNAVAGVSRWLDSQELGLTAPVENAAHVPSM